MPVLAAAHRLRDDPDPAARDALEARILANEPAADIAAKAAVDPAVVAGFERVFFDVRGRLGCRDFVLTRVVGPPPGGGPAHGFVVKLFGYLGGPRVVDAILGGRPADPRPASDADVDAFLAADGAAALRRWFAAAARTGDLQTAARAAAAIARAGRRDGDPDGAVQAELVKHVEAMLLEIPFAVGADAEAALPHTLAAFDGLAGELRDDEVQRLAAGGRPADPEALAAVVIPPPRRRPPPDRPVE
jgi:hypothetical protein